MVHNQATGSRSARRELSRATRCGLIGAALLLLPALCRAQSAPTYTITTVAGTGTAGFAGDAGAAASAQLNNPCGLLLDSAGNLYIADQVNVRIRKVDANGTITTITGDGTSGFKGDGAAATAAGISHPCGMAVDGSQNLYIADAANNVIRKITSAGIISTVAGVTTAGFAGDGGAATVANLDHPMAVAVDSAGNLYIADSGNNRIRKVTTDGKIATVAGTSTAGRSGDGGLATSAQLSYPESLTVDAAGNIYIADTYNHLIRKVAANGIITTIAGNGASGFSGDGPAATQVALSYPKQVALDASGNLFIADYLNSRIRMLAPGGAITTVAGNGVNGFAGDGGAATNAQLRFPSGVAVGAAGKIYVSDTENNRIRLLTPSQPVAGPPAISAGGVISASSFGGFTSAAPGTWIEIYGSNLAAATQGWTASDFNGVKAPTSLGGTQVTIGGQPAFISFVSPNQVNALVPSTLLTGSQLMTLTTAVGTTATYTINLSPAMPGFLAPQSLSVGGKQYAAALLPDNSAYILPTGAKPGVVSRPARPGETIVMYGVGFGSVTPAVGSGEIAQQAAQLTAPIRIFFGGAPAAVFYAGVAPGYVGLYQFNVIVPNIADSDAVPVTFTLGGVNGRQTLYTAVRN